MSTELTVLVWAALLGMLHILIAAQGRVAKAGYAWSASPRDGPDPQVGPVAARLARAQANFFETFPLFVAAVIAVQLSGHNSTATGWLAHLYLWGRVVYLPLYAAGIPGVRSLVWLATAGAIVGMLGLALFPA